MHKRLAIKMIKSTKNLKLHVKKDQFEAFMSDIFFWNSCPDFLSAFDSVQGMSSYILLNLTLVIKPERCWCCHSVSSSVNKLLTKGLRSKRQLSNRFTVDNSHYQLSW